MTRNDMPTRDAGGTADNLLPPGARPRGRRRGGGPGRGPSRGAGHGALGTAAAVALLQSAGPLCQPQGLLDRSATSGLPLSLAVPGAIPPLSLWP
jgi:hypothetical protein